MASHCFIPPAAVPAQTLANQWIGQHIPQVVPSQGSAQGPGLVITTLRPASLSRTHNCCARGLCTRVAASKSHMLSGQPIPLYRLQALFSEYRSSTLTSLSPLITDYFVIFSPMQCICHLPNYISLPVPPEQRTTVYVA